MIPEEFDAIGKKDIDALVANALSEGRTVEYKEQLPGGNDEDKKEFLADASSFANAGGGDLIFGVREKRDANGKPTGIPEAADGLVGVNADAEKRRLEDMLRAGIDPRIPGTRIRHIDGFPAGPVIIIRIPRSWASPHMVIFKNASRFYSRTSAGKHQLDVREVRAAFNASDGLVDKIKRLRDERLARIVAEETPVKLLAHPKLVLHLVPYTISDPAVHVDLMPFIENPSKIPPLNANAWSHRINFDGFLTYAALPANEAPYSYLQIFRSGVFEAVEARLLAPRDGKKTIPGIDFEVGIILAVEKYLAALTQLSVSPPIVVLAALHGVDGYWLAVESRLRQFVEIHAIDRSLLILPEVLVEDFSTPIDVSLRPIFDSVWQAVGLPRCEHYAPNGRWDGHRSQFPRP